MNLLKLGKLIRKVRKERGYRLEDVSDSSVSSATISNMERGNPSVHPDKIQYVMEKLGIDADLVSELEKNHQIEERLNTLEILFRIGKTEQAQKQIRAMKLPDSHALAPKAWQLIGKCALIQEEYEKAEHALNQSVRLAHDANQTELEASSYNALAMISFYRNELETALQQTEKGIEALQSKKSVIYYILKRNQAIYLERLNHVAQALQVVNEVWPDLHLINNLETVLSLYWSKSELLRRLEMFEEALSIAKEGLHLAQSNGMISSSFDQVTVIGSIYMQMEEWDFAQMYFDLALQFSGKVKKEKTFPTVWTRLAQLHLMKNEADEALPYLEKAVQTAKEFNDAPRWTDALIIQGDALRQSEQRERAIDCYEQAVKLCLQHQMKEKADHIFFRLSQCWEGIDESKFHETLQQRYVLAKQLEKEGIPT